MRPNYIETTVQCFRISHAVLAKFPGNLIHNIIPLGGACGVMVIVAGNGHGDTSSNPGRD